MKVTIIYDKMNGVNVQTLIYGEDVRYFAQNTKAVNYRYRGFDNLDELKDFTSDESLQSKDLAPFAFKAKQAFSDEYAMCEWICSMCEKFSDLKEIYIL